jgi:predicted metalloendopeptidase
MNKHILGRLHAPDGTRIPDWWSTQTDSAYKAARQCITDYYVRDIKTLSYTVNGVQLLVQLAGEPFSPTTLRHIGALRVAYATLNTTERVRQPGTNFTSEQTFFLAYAQTQCYQRQELLQLLRTQLGSYDERTALNAALINMPEFANAFQCQPKSSSCF